MQQTLQKIRPPFKVLNPLGYWISIAFVPFNFFLGVYLLAMNKGVVNLPFFNARGWGIIYLGLAIWLATGLKRDHLKDIRWAMIIGFAAKIYFMYVLLFLAFSHGFLRDLYVLDLWALAATVQALVIIFFIPREVVVNGRPRP